MSHIKKIIIDTDPGIDDALAIAFAAHHPELDLIGLTTVFGNVSVSLATENALRLVELLDINIPVCGGAQQPLVIPRNAAPDFVHGKNGFGEIALPPAKRKASQLSAAQFIVDQVRAAVGEIWLAPIGPLTNIALALRLAPDIADKVAGICLMGGAVSEPGNVSPVAEANIWNDPHAAEMVFAAHWPIKMIGLDATHKTTLNQAFFDQLQSQSTHLGTFLNDIHQFYLDFYQTRFDTRECAAHDSLAVLAVASEQLLHFSKGAIAVNCEGLGIGQTLFAPAGKFDHEPFWNSRPQHHAALNVDADAAIEQLIRVLKNAP